MTDERKSGAGSTSAGFGVLWVAIGQRLGDIGGWLEGSGELVTGYGEAMSLENGPGLDWPSSALLVVMLVVLLLDALRRVTGPARAGTVLLACVVVAAGFKAGFSRHDWFHHRVLFVLVVAIVIGLSPLVTRRRLVAGMLIVSCVAVVAPALYAVDAQDFAHRWPRALRAVGDPAGMATQGRADGRTTYGVPSSLLDLIGDHPLAVDPWDSAVAYDYGLTWRPWFVPQNYVAYTPSLDDANARSAEMAPADQRVLRREGAVIDARNPMWDSPAYGVALACSYRQERAEAGWVLLVHEPRSRCGRASTVGVPEVLGADEEVDVPEAPAGAILVARFVPEEQGLVSRTLAAAFKDFTAFRVTADGVETRMPEALASQPFIVTMPSRHGGAWPAHSLSTLAFSIPGTVEFSAIPMTGS